MFPEKCLPSLIEISKALHTNGTLPHVGKEWTHGDVFSFKSAPKVRGVSYTRGSERVKVLTQNPDKQTGKWWQKKCAEGHQVSQVSYTFKNPEGGVPRYNIGAGVIVDEEYKEYPKRGAK